MTANKCLDIVHPCNNPGLNWDKNILLNYQQLRSCISEDVKINVYIVDDGSCKGIESSHIEFLQKYIPHFHFITYKKTQGKDLPFELR